MEGKEGSARAHPRSLQVSVSNRVSGRASSSPGAAEEFVEAGIEGMFASVVVVGSELTSKWRGRTTRPSVISADGREGLDFRIDFSPNEKETRGFASSRCSTATTRDESSGIL